jgi:hypothetical protein
MPSGGENSSPPLTAKTLKPGPSDAPVQIEHDRHVHPCRLALQHRQVEVLLSDLIFGIQALNGQRAGGDDHGPPAGPDQ